jgi:hypothetical protein
MDHKSVVLVATVLACGWAALASAEDKAGSASSVVSITGMTRQTFEALAPDAMIEVYGERMTKREFIVHQQNAIKERAQRLEESRARATTKFEANRKAFLDREKAKLEEDNKRVQAEVARLGAANAAAHREPTIKDR